MDKPILGYGVISGPDHKMRSSFSVAEMWAAIDEYAEARSEMDYRNDRGHFHRTEGAQEWHDRARQRVRDLLGLTAAD